VIFWQAWRFITPGMKAAERKYAIPFVSAAIVFFSAGVVVAYYIFARPSSGSKASGEVAGLALQPQPVPQSLPVDDDDLRVTFLFPVVLVAIELAGSSRPSSCCGPGATP